MLVLIPARLGSKGLKNKNIKNFHGKPLIAHTIIAAKKVKKVNRIIVVTESKKIKKIAEKFGAEVPFLRPKRLATSSSLAIDSYIYTIKKIQKNEKKKIRTFMVLLPTSPLRNSNHITKALNKFNSKKHDSLISVSRSDVPISWNKILDKKGFLKEIFIENGILKNRQHSRASYIPNGAIYIFKFNLLEKYRKYIFKKTIAFIMDKRNSIDIDNVGEFNLAKKYFKN